MKLATKLSFLLILFTVTISFSQSNKALKTINETSDITIIKANNNKGVYARANGNIYLVDIFK